MSYNQKKREYNVSYTRTHIKRVPLEMQLWQYDRLKAAADAAGESVNGYIKKAIAMRMQAETRINSDDLPDK